MGAFFAFGGSEADSLRGPVPGDFKKGYPVYPGLEVNSTVCAWLVFFVPKSGSSKEVNRLKIDLGQFQPAASQPGPPALGPDQPNDVVQEGAIRMILVLDGLSDCVHPVMDLTGGLDVQEPDGVGDKVVPDFSTTTTTIDISVQDAQFAGAPITLGSKQLYSFIFHDVGAFR